MFVADTNAQAVTAFCGTAATFTPSQDVAVLSDSTALPRVVGAGFGACDLTSRVPEQRGARVQCRKVRRLRALALARRRGRAAHARYSIGCVGERVREPRLGAEQRGRLVGGRRASAGSLSSRAEVPKDRSRTRALTGLPNQSLSVPWSTAADYSAMVGRLRSTCQRVADSHLSIGATRLSPSSTNSHR